MGRISYIHRRHFATHTLKTEKKWSEIVFLVITALALFGPTVLLCVALSQVWPLLLVVGSDVIGATFGIARFNKPALVVVSCIPQRALSNTPVSNNITELRKAA